MARKTSQTLHDPAAIDELLAWFRARMDRLPASMPFLPGMNIPNLPETVQKYIEMTELNRENTTYSPQISHLFRMREKLMAQGLD